MTTPEPQGEDAGWRADPENPRIQRWWDGIAWTNQTRYEAAKLVAEPLTAPPPSEEPDPVTRAALKRMILVGGFAVLVAVLLVLFFLRT